MDDMDYLRTLEDEHKRILNTLRKGRLDRAQRICNATCPASSTSWRSSRRPTARISNDPPCLPEVTGGGRSLCRDGGPSHRFARTAIAIRMVGRGRPFPDPAALLIQPDHYLVRMLYSLGCFMEDLGVGPGSEGRDSRAMSSASSRGTGMRSSARRRRMWMDFTLYGTIGVETPLSPDAADLLRSDRRVAGRSREPPPRAVRPVRDRGSGDDRCRARPTWSITTAIAASGWTGRVIPTFRPDDLLNPARPNYASS
jgi:hypothetical protein